MINTEAALIWILFIAILAFVGGFMLGDNVNDNQTCGDPFLPDLVWQLDDNDNYTDKFYLCGGSYCEGPYIYDPGNTLFPRPVDTTNQ